MKNSRFVRVWLPTILLLFLTISLIMTIWSLTPKGQEEIVETWVIETEFQKIGSVYVSHAREGQKNGLRIVTIDPKTCPNGLNFPKIGDNVKVILYRSSDEDKEVAPKSETKTNDIVIQIPRDFIKAGSLEPECR